MAGGTLRAVSRMIEKTAQSPCHCYLPSGSRRLAVRCICMAQMRLSSTDFCIVDAAFPSDLIYASLRLASKNVTRSKARIEKFKQAIIAREKGGTKNNDRSPAREESIVVKQLDNGADVENYVSPIHHG